jgi:hypothetical protein
MYLLNSVKLSLDFWGSEICIGYRTCTRDSTKLAALDWPRWWHFNKSLTLLYSWVLGLGFMDENGEINKLHSLLDTLNPKP